MITKLKIYEKVWSKNIIEGNIYVIDTILISSFKYKQNINLGKIIKKEKNSWDNSFSITLKTYINDTFEKYIWENFPKIYLKRIANKEEIKRFKKIEIIEKTKKYNL